MAKLNWSQGILRSGKMLGKSKRRYMACWISKSILAAVLIVLAVVRNQAVVAQDKVLTDFLAAVQAASDKVNSFSTDFTQEKELAMFDRPVIFEGRLNLVRPDKLRWEFFTPIKSVLIFNGESGLRCTEQQQNAFELASDPVMRMVAEQLWLWLGGDYQRLASTHDLEMLAPAGLLISPKGENESAYISALTILFDEKTLQPRQVMIFESGGDRTNLTFHSGIINGEVPAHLFSECRHDE